MYPYGAEMIDNARFFAVFDGIEGKAILAVLDARGVIACSRWLSEERAIPPDYRYNWNPHPEGVPAPRD